ncbi:MAG TPA: tetraacyldisaccharide 4'-kinase, partial [Casimicrobiaceae bacterium]|nr:tetraacyldisaccharide 4'-kinase [Casimicrobiaceae bacterium]
MAFRDRLVASWYAPRRTPLALALWPLALLFRAVVALRRALYAAGVLRSERAPVPVVVVGNLAVGGAGKTPLVVALAAALAARGRRPGIVSRGYGGTVRGVREVRPGDDPAIVGDEPLLLAATGHPVVVGRDRPAAVRALLAAHPACDVVVCDDGLQHYALARDVEIAVVDASRGLGNGLVLPAGPLREPAARLARVDAVVTLVAADGEGRSAPPRETTMTHVPAGFRNLADPSRAVDPAAWAGRRVHAIAGIGHPQRFFDLLARLGVRATPHPFDDHHAFTPDDLALPDADVIVMTAKDAVKCSS